MKKIVLLLNILTSLVLISCNNSNDRVVVINENMQDKFFDVSFGTSKDTLINVLEKEGFCLDKNNSTEYCLNFSYPQSKYYSFGGYGWEMLTTYISNDKFVGIRFMNCSEDKKSAMDLYEKLNKSLSKKYEATTTENNDTTVYGLSCFYGKEVEASAACFRYESIAKQILIGITLEYKSIKEEYLNSAEEEL